MANLNRTCILVASALLLRGLSLQAYALDDASAKQAEAVAAKAVEYLRKTQNPDGSWQPKVGPAITALALTALIDRPEIGADDPAVQKALKYILSRRKPDGGIHDGNVDNYNTAICLSALSRFNDQPEVAQAIKEGLAFLRKIQWAGQKDEQGRVIDEKHPFYGGWGYGKHGRPDASNTQITIQAFYDNNVDCEKDEAIQRALVFTRRLQGTPSNTEYGPSIVPDGGFIYATSVNRNQVGQPQTMSDEVVGDDGKSRLRTYGSMTYACFKTLIYAKVDPSSPQVQDAVKWIRNNYTVDHNPGMPEKGKMQGYFYYLLTMARTLNAWQGADHKIQLASGQQRDWAVDLINKLSSLQKPDGSFVNEADRWMEGDSVLVTSYALLALQQAAK